VTLDSQHTYDKAAIARSVARMLLEIKAVLFRADDPFTLTSGMKSPVYIDCRKIIAFPRMRAQMMDYGRTVIMNDIGYESLDAVAGGETAGIPFAAWLAERTALPMHYVRKKPKGFGRDARIEGDIQDGQRVLLVEDLTTDGGSKLSFVNAIREAGAEVGHTFVIFYYDIFKDTQAVLTRRSCPRSRHSFMTRVVGRRQKVARNPARSGVQPTNGTTKSGRVS
jgi:orotate phosphoribosyltransferase